MNKQYKSQRDDDLYLRFDANGKPLLHTMIGDRKTVAIPLSDHDVSKLRELADHCRAADRARRHSK